MSGLHQTCNLSDARIMPRAKLIEAQGRRNPTRLIQGPLRAGCPLGPGMLEPFLGVPSVRRPSRHSALATPLKDASGPTLIFAHGLHERPTKSKAFAVAAVSRGQETWAKSHSILSISPFESLFVGVGSGPGSPHKATIETRMVLAFGHLACGKGRCLGSSDDSFWRGLRFETEPYILCTSYSSYICAFIIIVFVCFFLAK